MKDDSDLRRHRTHNDAIVMGLVMWNQEYPRWFIGHAQYWCSNT